MAETDTAEALLTVALQDLRAAEVLLVERLPDLRDAVRDPALKDELARLVAAARARAERLRATGRAEGGDPNLWMAGVLDDGERDTRSTAAGPLLDVALIGAVRKGVVAALESYETAMALADGELAAMLTGYRDAHREHNDALAGLLAAIA